MEAEGTPFDHVHYLHSELNELEVLCLAVWSEIENFGMTLEDATSKYGITIEQYNANIEKALS